MIQEEKKPGYKKTKIGWIPENWELKLFGELFEYLKTYSYSRSELSYVIKNNKPVYNIHYGDIHTKFSNQIIDLEKIKLPVINDPIEITKDNFLKDGDIVIADASEDYEGIGKCVEIFNVKNKNVIGGLHTFVSRDKLNKTRHGFRSYLFLSSYVRRELRKIAVGISVYGISKTNLAKIQVILPPLPEQKKIAEILSTWDQTIEKLNTLIDKKKLIKKGLMQQMLTGKKRLPGFNSHWIDAKLGSFFVERNETGYIGLDLLSIGEAGVFPQSESNKRDISNSDKTKYKRICPGDIGYNTMRLWQGRCALSNLEGIVSPAYTIVIPKGNANEKFFAYLFKLPQTVHKFYRNSQGLVSDTLNCKFKDFKLVKVSVPNSYDEQLRIAQILESFDCEIKNLLHKKELFEQQKKGLMQQLLTGKRRVKLF